MATNPKLMTAINVSPESFFKGSVASQQEERSKAVALAVENGASMIDLGAMSTAPYKETQITEEEETERLVKAVKNALPLAGSVPISADTQRATVAHAALEAGATWINDVSALSHDPAMAETIAHYKAGAILMANETTTLDEAGRDPVSVVMLLLEEALNRARNAGINEEKIILDPGVGFFRNRSIPWHQWDLALLKNIPTFLTLGYPILIGASRKSFIGHLLHRPDPNDRLAGSLAVAQFAASQGAPWLRVHDIAQTRDILMMNSILTTNTLFL